MKILSMGRVQLRYIVSPSTKFAKSPRNIITHMCISADLESGKQPKTIIRG